MRRVSFKLSFSCAVVACLWACLLAVPSLAVTIDMVTVGNAGNANDTTGYGGVNYSYQIGKYDVTIGQYTSFLNAAATTDTYSLYNAGMATDGNIKGISRVGSSGSYTYSVMNNFNYSTMNNDLDSSNHPITYVSWFDAARFANWMTNGQGAGSTETGAYTLGGATSGNAVAANPGAAFYIPTENQWYKAAYFDPTLNSGAGGYYTYATQSNAAPGNVIGSGANQANHKAGDVFPLGAYSVTHSPGYDVNQNYLTDVGAFSGSGSFYGTFDQSGNVNQWNDLDGTPGSSRGLRGGSWGGSRFDLSSSYSVSFAPSNQNRLTGFRLASPVAVPEPSTCAMALAGLACGGYTLFRRRKQA